MTRLEKQFKKGNVWLGEYVVEKVDKFKYLGVSERDYNVIGETEEFKFDQIMRQNNSESQKLYLT